MMTTEPDGVLLELEVEVEEEVPELPAGAVGTNVACALERQELAAAPTVEGAGGLGTTVAFPAKLQD